MTFKSRQVDVGDDGPQLRSWRGRTRGGDGHPDSVRSATEIRDPDKPETLLVGRDAVDGPPRGVVDHRIGISIDDRLRVLSRRRSIDASRCRPATDRLLPRDVGDDVVWRVAGVATVGAPIADPPMSAAGHTIDVTGAGSIVSGYASALATPRLPVGVHDLGSSPMAMLRHAPPIPR